jgi:hypothetical protein
VAVAASGAKDEAEAMADVDADNAKTSVLPAISASL